jgi:S1-C subfamily serine protease
MLGTISFTSNTFTPNASSLSLPIHAGNLLSSLRFSQNHTDLDLTLSDVSSATVCVKTRKGWDEQACAAGVSIDPQLAGLDPMQGAVVLTNYHVIAGMGSRPPLQLGGKGEVFNAEIIRQSPEFDLALLLVPRVKFPTAVLAETTPGRGTEIRAIGFPNDQPLTIKDSSLLGTTQNCLAIAPCLALQQGTITFGNSGGPLEANGKVIGIAQGEIEDEVAIPVEQIRQFLSGQVPFNSGSPPVDPNYPPMMPPVMREAPPSLPHPMEAPPPYYVW